MMLSNGPSKNQLKTIRQIAWVLIAVLLVWFYVTHHAPPADDKDSITPITQVTQPFTLQTKTGKAFTEKDLGDKPTMMFFGFTHCPAICPGAMADMGIWLEKLGKDAGRVNAVFVSVDPERDTPARLTEFLKSYDKRIIGLTGTLEQVTAMTKSYGIYFKKMPAMKMENGNGGDYMVDHGASILLYDKERHLISTIDTMENRDIALAKIKKLVGLNP